MEQDLVAKNGEQGACGLPSDVMVMLERFLDKGNNDKDSSMVFEEISPPKDAETPVESSIPVSTSSSVGSSSPVRLITPPPNYPFDESIFAELDNSLWIIPRPLRTIDVLRANTSPE
nr:hypothetical protein [Tanacetum cinerariifolium]